MCKEFLYKVGDRVYYFDNMKELKVGTIKEIEKTNDETRNLYLLTNYPYLRYEEEILGLAD